MLSVRHCSSALRQRRYNKCGTISEIVSRDQNVVQLLWNCTTHVIPPLPSKMDSTGALQRVGQTLTVWLQLWRDCVIVSAITETLGIHSLVLGTVGVITWYHMSSHMIYMYKLPWNMEKGHSWNGSILSSKLFGSSHKPFSKWMVITSIQWLPSSLAFPSQFLFQLSWNRNWPGNNFWLVAESSPFYLIIVHKLWIATTATVQHVEHPGWSLHRVRSGISVSHSTILIWNGQWILLQTC